MTSTTHTPTEALERFRRDMEEVQASLGEDKDAQRSLLRRMSCIPRILAAKNAQLGSPLDSADLEDLSQETVLLVWEKRGDFGGHSTLESWIFPFCYHALMNRFRKRRREPRTIEVEAASNVVARTEHDFQHVHEAIQELPPDEREVVHARYFDHLGFSEIAEILGTSISAVKHRCYRGMDRLRSRLSDLEEGGSYD